MPPDLLLCLKNLPKREIAIKLIIMDDMNETKYDCNDCRRVMEEDANSGGSINVMRRLTLP